jgi:uncharacterized protein (DUF169 family)
MSNKELELNLLCRRLAKISGSDWVAIKFRKQIPGNDIEPLRFCEAVSKAKNKQISLSVFHVCCDGAKRCFGWLKNNDEKLAQGLSRKTGMEQDAAYELIRSVPVLNDKISGISLGKDIEGDVYISYACPKSAMKVIRCWQKMTGRNLNTEISGIMSVCGNVAVKSFLKQKISISFGCPDSRKYGGIENGELVIGIPHNIAFSLCSMSS